ncbi:DNA cytosine methyltransferase [Candidatus Magnetobacterium casensis]|uniref:DNA cytosine methyltransferase n=1 Tax=Candidatus Magnetobacterium casense TaxID=1455061 RepID=A0ABS6S3W7_9BACT|nr:DNA cytosine methyltransferase [Candidatus Magnetobacterium casensis]
MPIVEDIRDVERIKEVVANAEETIGQQSRHTRAGRAGLTDSGSEEIITNATQQPKREPEYQADTKPNKWEAWPVLSSRSTDTGNGGAKPQSPAILVTAGFPCQPFSVAGLRQSERDDRYLWPQTIAVIKEIRPQWVLLENVTGIINLALDTVLSDLEGAGYATETLIIPACAVNAWHRRDRIWIVSFLDHPQCTGYLEQPGATQALKVRNGPQNRLPKSPVQDDAYTQRTGLERANPERDPCPTGQFVQSRQDVANSTDGEPQRGGSQCHVRGLENEVLRSRWDPDYWAVEPELGRVAHGIPHRVDRLKCLGNAIVPQVAYEIIKVIIEIDEGVPQNTYTVK